MCSRVTITGPHPVLFRGLCLKPGVARGPLGSEPWTPWNPCGALLQGRLLHIPSLCEFVNRGSIFQGEKGCFQVCSLLMITENPRQMEEESELP